MRIKDLYEGASVDFNKDDKRTMAPTMSLKDMGNGYEYYRFLIAMAGHPENHLPTESVIRDNPIAIAYTPEEYDMIHHEYHFSWQKYG